MTDRIGNNLLKRPLVVVWFSCGAASAVAAKITLDQYSSYCDVKIVNNPVAEEDDDNRRFLTDVESWLKHPIEIATNSKHPGASADQVWRKRRFMSGVHGAPCTIELKKNARYEWEKANPGVDFMVLGFTADEKSRFDRFVLTERSNVLPVLIENKMTKDDCFEVIIKAGLRLPKVYRQGYPNANCIGCVKATSPTYWNHVRKVHPDIFSDRAKLSRELGARLVRVNNERIFLDELPVDAIGRPMKQLPSIDCGIFCEEK